jgi:RNA polymerase sigma factor (sigma-70 family)
MSTSDAAERSDTVDMTTAVAVAGVVTDDPAAEYQAVLSREGRKLYALALSVLGDRAEAEDALQETMERAWRSWDQLRQPERRGSWLATICVRRSLALRHRLRLRRRDAAVDAPDTPELAAVVVPGGDIDLTRALRTLSRQQRAVVALHYIYGYTLDDCAPVMGCSPGSVRTHLSRALATLRERLGDA